MRKEIEAQIKEAFKQKPLEGLALHGLKIKDSEIPEIIERLKERQEELLYLSFDNNQISDDGACRLALALKDFSNLKKIRLQGNKINALGLKALFLLEDALDLSMVALRGNPFYPMDEVQLIRAFEKASIEDKKGWWQDIEKTLRQQLPPEADENGAETNCCRVM